MNPPVFPPLIEIVLVVLAEMLFGLAYNGLVRWLIQRRLYDTLISFSVAGGVFVTVAMPAGLWFGRALWAWQWALLMLIAFAASGSVMIAGSLKREADKSHHRREWPTAAAHARDDAVMELSALAHKAAEGEISLAQLVNRLHEVVGILKSV
jgi:hypothetical protein